MAQQSGLTSAVQELAGELLPRTPELARGMAEHLYAAIPELSAIEDDELRAELLRSTEANIGQVLRLLADGATADDVVIPHEALEFLRARAPRHSAGRAAALLSARPRLAVGALVASAPGARRGLRRAGRRAGSELGLHVRLRRQGLRCSRRAVRDRARPHDAQRDPLRAETVRTILAGEPIDEEVASRRLGYELGRQHVALRIASPGSEVRGLERTVGEAAAALGRGEPLVVASGAARSTSGGAPSTLRQPKGYRTTSPRRACS